VVTPPPICEYKTSGVVYSIAQERFARVTKLYADVAQQTAEDLGVECLNLWKIFMEYAGWKEGDPLLGGKDAPKSEKLESLLSDGLHLTTAGYQLYLRGLMGLIKEKLPELHPDNISNIFPPYDIAPRTD